MFDFDGLILDTEGAVFQAAAEIHAEHGYRLTQAEWAETIGRYTPPHEFYDRLEAIAGRALDRDRLGRRRRQRVLDLVLALEVLPGVERWVAACDDLRLPRAVASSSSRDWVLGHLRRLGLGEGWAAVVCRDDVARAKPAPDLYLAAAAALRAEATGLLAIEDSPNGIAAARAAGLRCLAVPGPMTRGLDFSLAHAVADSLAELDPERFLTSR